MPLDFVPQYPKLDTVVVTEGDMLDFFRARSSSSVLADHNLEEEQKILNEYPSSSQLIQKETVLSGKKPSDPAPAVGKLPNGVKSPLKKEPLLGNKKESGPLTPNSKQGKNNN